MEQALWYVAGLVTPLTFLAGTLIWEWVTDRNYSIDCHRCGRSFGEIGEDYKQLSKLRFRWHRRNGECQRNTK